MGRGHVISGVNRAGAIAVWFKARQRGKASTLREKSLVNSLVNSLDASSVATDQTLTL